jgi:hypothetical protein
VQCKGGNIQIGNSKFGRGHRNSEESNTEITRITVFKLDQTKKKNPSASDAFATLSAVFPEATQKKPSILNQIVSEMLVTQAIWRGSTDNISVMVLWIAIPDQNPQFQMQG